MTVISDGCIDFPHAMATAVTPEKTQTATRMPLPGVGRIVKDGGALRWLVADRSRAA